MLCGALLGSFARCSARQPSIGDLAAPQGTISIRVVNRNPLDVVVYVVHDATHTRVGLATAATSTDFVVPLRVLGAGSEYRLVGDPVGSGTPVTTEVLHARVGDKVTWSLEDNFARSTVVVH